MWGFVRLQVSMLSILQLFLIASEQVDLCYPSESPDAHRNAGFGGSEVPHALVEQCHINVVDARDATFADFLEKCKDIPCLVRNAVDASWTGAWSLENLTKSYGEFQARIQVKTGGEGRANEEASDYQEYQPVKQELGRFVEAEMMRGTGRDMVWDWADKGLLYGKSNKTWRFGKGDRWENYQESLGLHPLRDRVIPDLITKFYTNATVMPIADSFVAGGACAGTFFHNHGPALAILPHGMKRWAFLQPEVQGLPEYHMDATGDKRHVLFFHDHVPADLGEAPTAYTSETGLVHPVLLCTQNAGDALFIPAQWHHTTINIWPSVAAIMEMSDGKVGNASSAGHELLELYRKVWQLYGMSKADLFLEHERQLGTSDEDDCGDKDQCDCNERTCPQAAYYERFGTGACHMNHEEGILSIELDGVTNEECQNECSYDSECQSITVGDPGTSYPKFCKLHSISPNNADQVAGFSCMVKKSRIASEQNG